MTRRLLSVALAALTATSLTSCIKTAPSGPGSVDQAGKPRDPGEILAVGTAAPDFDAVDSEGNRVRLADLKGNSAVVLIFYPGDDTPGCTKQLCSARDSYGDYEKAGARVFGVNPAAADSHEKFRKKFSYPFPLLVDTDGKMIRDYGCRGVAGITTRTVYVIAKDGTISFAKRGAPETSEILAAVK